MSSARRSKGEGHAGRRKDGRWYASLEHEGTRRTVYSTVSRADVVRKLDDLKRQRDEGRWHSNPTSTVADVLDAWLEAREAKGVRYNTLIAYQIAARQLKAHLGSIRLDKLTPTDIQRAYRSMGRDGLPDKKIRYNHDRLRSALRMGVNHRLLSWNPAQAVEVPQPEPRVVMALSREQLLQLFADTEGTRWHAPVVVAGTTGLRFSELRSLTWEMVSGGSFHLTEQVQYRMQEGYWATPLKSKRSERDIVLAQRAIDALSAHRAIQLREKAAAKVWEERVLCFTGLTGQPLNHSVFSDALNRALLKQSLVGYGPHSLRHSIITLWIDDGVPVPTVSEWAGHANPTITLREYAHAVKRRTDEMGRLTDRLLAPETPVEAPVQREHVQSEERPA